LRCGNFQRQSLKDKKMKSYTFRNQPLFLRNSFQGTGRWSLPIVKKQHIKLDHLNLLSYNNTRYNEAPMFRDFAVHFFVDDKRFESVYDQPERSYEKLKQYKILFTPDFSLYGEMQPWRRIENVGKSRWCGAFWQSKGAIVIPTISWSTPESYDYTFDGVEIGSYVAIGMIGCRKSKKHFLNGFFTMCDRIQPKSIICFGTPFQEMLSDKLIIIDYVNSWRLQ